MASHRQPGSPLTINQTAHLRALLTLGAASLESSVTLQQLHCADKVMGANAIVMGGLREKGLAFGRNRVSRPLGSRSMHHWLTPEGQEVARAL